jgi:hypothetical protein
MSTCVTGANKHSKIYLYNITYDNPCVFAKKTPKNQTLLSVLLHIEFFVQARTMESTCYEHVVLEPITFLVIFGSKAPICFEPSVLEIIELILSSHKDNGMHAMNILYWSI